MSDIIKLKLKLLKKNENRNLKIKLKNITCSVIKLDSNNKAYPEYNIKIENSPWVIYLEKNETKKLYDSFYATRKHPKFSNDYWYDLEKFNLLLESIKNHGYKNNFCNNIDFQKNFNGNNWQGGKGPIKISKKGSITDGHHRCAILYYLYGANFTIEIKNDNTIKDIPPLNKL